MTGLEQRLIDALLADVKGEPTPLALAFARGVARTVEPVVTAWHEERVAEVVARVKAVPTYKVITEDESLGYVVIADDVLDALAADDRTGQRCTDCGRALTSSHEERTSGLCLRCLNGPVPDRTGQR